MNVLAHRVRFGLERSFKPHPFFEIFGSIVYFGYGTFRLLNKNDSAGKIAEQQAVANAKAIAADLYLPKDAVQTLLLAHGGHHIQQIQQLKDQKYQAEAQTWEEATADALAKQFSKKFSDAER